MGILRSEEMRRGTLVLPTERARYFVDQLGSRTSMQFDDMHAQDMYRPYKKYVQRIDEMERILRFLTDELARVPGAVVTTNRIEDFLSEGDYKLDAVEPKLTKIYKDFVQLKEHNTKLVDKRNAALERRFVLHTAVKSMSGSSGDVRGEDVNVSRSLLEDEARQPRAPTVFSTVAGVLPQAEQDRFARALFRATRGNTYTHFEEIRYPMQEPNTGKAMYKAVFVVYYQDHRANVNSAMSDKIRKVCNSFGVNTYSWPKSQTESEEMQATLEKQVEEMDRMLIAHEDHVRSESAMLLSTPRENGNSLIEEWRLFCAKEKGIYATLNLFEGHSNLRASCWYPASEEEAIRIELQALSSSSAASAMLVSDHHQPKSQPPTYIRTNDFTRPFQDLVDTYGIPRYQEVNPALLTIVTFPFLFGVMYGDIGHGSFLLVAGLLAIRHSDTIKKDPVLEPTLHYGRYMLTMMGGFAVFAGLLYNDFFSLGLNLFGSRWESLPSEDNRTIQYVPLYDIKNEGGSGPYPFGLDPSWHGANNELIYVNSMKMKMSVVIGVTQMTAGVLLRWVNALHQRSFVDFFFECVPMLAFLLCFFGFMIFQILYKWVTALADPPSIINSMISMGMVFVADSNPMFGDVWPFRLMMITLATIPVMLFPKPVFLYMKFKTWRTPSRRGGRGRAHHPVSDEESLGLESDEEDAEVFEWGEVLMHQIIETIEYVLGTISHTASYLRLWALSLAHQQLAVVFFEKSISAAMCYAFPLNAVVIYVIGYPVWLGATVMILLGMDVMECFLHTLRLHWVEFQSKFYKADGYVFVPYRHRTILATTNTE